MAGAVTGRGFAVLVCVVVWVAAAGCSGTAGSASGSLSVGGCAEAPSIKDSVRAYERALAETPYDNWEAYYDRGVYDAMVADSQDPTTRMAYPLEPDTQREVLKISVGRTERSVFERWAAQPPAYSGDKFSAKVRIFTDVSDRAHFTGLPVPVGPAAHAGPVLLELYDSQGRLLLSRWYPVSVVQPDGPVGPNAPRPPIEQGWRVHVDRPPQWSCLRMLADASLPPTSDSTVIEIAASPNPPVVEFTAPRPGQILYSNERAEVAWAASDPDGDDLASDIDGRIAATATARIATAGLSAGTHVLTVTATDSSDTAASASVTVKAANGAPTARADSVFGRAGRTRRAGVVANDTDPEGDIDPWSLAVAVPAALGTAAPDRAAPGTITYSAAAAGIDVAVYEVCDRFLQCASAELVIAILEDH